MANDKVIIELDLELDKASVQKQAKTIEKTLEATGDKASKSFTSKFRTGLNSLNKVSLNLNDRLLALGATLAAAFASKQVIDAAARQADAINSINSSLQRIGEFSQETSNDLRAFASELQNVTKFGDEAVLEQLAFAQALGATAEQSKEVVRAAADLSAGLNIDLNSATRNVAKTLGGYAGELGEVLPALKTLTKEQLQNGEGVRLLGELYGGLAQKDAKTFSGVLAQLSNAFGDLQEEIGLIVTESPVIRKAISVITEGIQGITKSISEIDGQTKIKELTIAFIDLGIQLADGLLMPLQLVSNTFSLFFSGINTGIAAIVAGIGGLGSALAGLADLAGLETLSQGLSDFGESSLSVFNENVEATRSKLDNLFNTESSEALKARLIELKEVFIDVSTVAASTSAVTAKTVSASNKASAESFKNLGAIVEGVLKTQVVRSLEFLGASLLNQENFFKGFLGIILDAFGTLLISIGTAAITVGTVAESIQKAIITLFGGQAIVAGVASIALGGALKAFAGSLGGSSSSVPVAGGLGSAPSSSNPSSDLVSPTATTQIQDEEIQPEKVTNITIEGLIGGRELVNIINQSIDDEGVQLNIGFA